MPKVKSVQKSSKKEQLFQGIRGMPDILPKDQGLWKSIWQAGLAVSELHNFHFMETPGIEMAGLFEAAVGMSTDIVEKQMYVFKTPGGDRVALRPEGSAPIMRSYLEHHLGYFASPLKVFYYEPFFRHERSQAGRYRQFHQWGFEIIGDGDPFYDGEIILASLDFLKALKLKDLKVKINTMGCRVCRPTYRQRLKDYYRYRKNSLCSDCKRRYEKNPFRLLDCKEEECQAVKKNAPIILDYLCQNCNNHFKGVLELVEDNNVLYEPDPYLVRGLDYYNRTVFEIFSPVSDSSLGGGGRYDYLSEILGGRMIPAVGAAMGLERIIEVLNIKEIKFQPKEKLRIFFAAVGETAKKKSLRLLQELRAAGIITVEAIGRKSLRAQLKAADKSGAALTILVGQKEIFEGTLIIRDMQTGVQETVLLNKMVEEIKKRLK